MENNKNEFVLDSKGRCFLCLDKISTVDEQGQGSEQMPFPKYSLHFLSRYLKMDMRKVFRDMAQIPPHLLTKVENLSLKVELCEECVRLSEQFSENYRQLEKAEMELGSCLRLINGKFLDVSEEASGKLDSIKKLTNVEPDLKLNDVLDLEILEVLREEAFQKSHRKLRAGVPRVICSKLTAKTIRAEKLKFQASINFVRKSRPQRKPVLVLNIGPSSKSDLETSGSEIKSETRDFLLYEDNCTFDDFNVDNEAICEDTERTMEENNDVDTTEAGPNSVMNSVTKICFQQKTKSRAKRPVWNVDRETGKYRCDTCSMEFTSWTGVDVHYESVHLNVRFQCDTCGKEFSQLSACNRHKKSVHGGVRHSCQVCNKSFTQTFRVRQHQRVTECGKKLDLKSMPFKP